MGMSFQDAVRTCFSKYSTFSGRARRSEYWYFVLFGFLGSAIASIFDAEGIFSIVTLLPGLSVMVRRLHDTGRSGWWFWIILIPLIGALVLLWFLITPGEEGTNDYGPDPIAGPDSTSRVPRVAR